jgi:hypothetical protein
MKLGENERKSRIKYVSGHEHKLLSPSRMNVPWISRQLVLAGGVSCP